jgi:hypothetical protein
MYGTEEIMNKVKVLIIACVALMAGSALGACPDVVGLWSSNPELNPDYPLLNGRYSEAWCSGAGPLEPGNTINAASWDGAALGLEWQMSNMAIGAGGTTLVFDGVSGGNGVRIYQTVYEGGDYWLGGDGDWTIGNVELNGFIVDFLIISTKYYVGGVVTAVVNNISFSGVFTECESECEIEFAIANAARIWHSGQGGAMPANYPAFLCGASTGELYTTSDITFSIICAPVAVESQSWSSVKDMFR